MGLSFQERMQGHLVDPAGRAHAIDFELAAEASHVRSFLRTGRARITGVVHVDPWARRAPLEGTITIRPVIDRFIRYEFTFRDPDDRLLSFVGQKDVSLRRIVETMTHMRATLRHGENEIATGEMTFDANDLGAFLASAFPAASIRRLDLLAASDDGVRVQESPLTPRERAILAAFADATIEPGGRVPAADETTVCATEQVLSHMPSSYVSGLRAMLRALDAYALLRRRKGFARLSRPDRVALIGELDAAAGPEHATHAATPHHLLHAVGMPLRVAHFGRKDFLEAIGAPSWENRVREADPEWTSRITTAEDLDAETTIDCDVVVVGTGAGGGPAAAILAERGLAVAVLEEGRYLGRREFSGPPPERMRKLYRDFGLTVSLGAPPISIPLGRMVGGTTAINSGTAFRTPDHVLAEWRNELAFSDEFHADTFARWLDPVCDELGVAPADRRVLGRIADVVARGADEMNLPHGPLPRNAPGCDGQGACVFGCPTDAKRSSNVSWIPRAVRGGAALFTGLPVSRMLVHGRDVVAVEARGTDRFGSPKVLRVRARAVVLACGSLLTPNLLKSHGFTSPWIGRNLSVHPGLGMWVRCDGPMDPWRAIPQGYMVGGHESDGIKFEGYWLPPDLAASAIPLLGAELTRWMDAQAEVGQFGFMVRDEGVGTVHRGLDGRPLVRYDLSDRTAARLRKGASILAELLLRGGGREVLTSIRRVPPVTTIEQARVIAHAPIRAVDFNLLGSHPLGTCRIASRPELGVCDLDHRVFGTSNLYVMDGSSVPTSLGVNPQVTIMALALRAAESLAARLSPVH